MTNLEVLLSRRAKLMEKLNGILAGMCDDDETEITNKIRGLQLSRSEAGKSFNINRLTRPRARRNPLIYKDNMGEVLYIYHANQ